MKHWKITEKQNPIACMNDIRVRIGDRIEVISNNQQGYKLFEVRKDEKGNKILFCLENWDN